PLTPPSSSLSLHDALPICALEPISVLAAYPLILIGRGSLPFDNLPDLIAYARANPGKINYGHQGKGQTGHLLGELLMLKGKFRIDRKSTRLNSSHVSISYA